jgi:hypothetical protein
MYIYPTTHSTARKVSRKCDSIGSCIVNVSSLDTEYTEQIATGKYPQERNMVWSHAIKKQENNKSYAINVPFLQYRSLLSIRPKTPAPGKSEVDVGGIE